MLDDEPPPPPRRRGVPPPDREHAARPFVARDRRAGGADIAPPGSGAVTGRHGVERPGDGRADHGPRSGHRRAPETSGPDGSPHDLHPGGRRPAGAAAPGDARADHGGRRRAGHEPARSDPARITRGRHGVDRPAIDRPGDVDRNPLDGGDRPEPRRSRTAGPDHRDAPDRPDGRRLPDTPGSVRTRRDDVAAALRRRWPWVVGAAAAAVAVPIALVVLGGPDDGSGATQAGGTVAIERSADSGGSDPAPAGDPAATDAPAAPAATEVTFEVTGSGSVGAITYSRGASVGQVSGVELPWEQTGPAAAEPTEYSVSAAGGSGEISCRIVVDGVVLVEESDSEYSAVSCSGRR